MLNIINKYSTLSVYISVRFVGRLGGLTPPLVEDNPHTGD